MDFGLTTEYQTEDFTFTLPSASKREAQPDLLSIIQSLHSSLEPRTVFSCFGKILSQHLPIVGIQLPLSNHHLIWGIGQGQMSKNYLSFHGEHCEIQYRISSPLSPKQITLLHRFQELLIQPLENALQYDEMSRKAMFDSLTSLGNRRYYQQAIETAVARYHRSKNDISLMLLDLNNFKFLNDRYGHQLGDTILAEFGILLQKTTREADQAFRIGGDEFAIIIHGDTKACECLKQRINAMINKDPLLQQFGVQSSIGISELSNQQTAKQLYAEADKDLYANKPTAHVQ